MSHPSIFYKYTTPGTTELILRNSRLRWSSPLIFNDVAEFQRMPRLEPSMNEAYKLFSNEIASLAFGDKEINEEALNPNMQRMLREARKYTADGMTREELIKRLAVQNPTADAEVEATLRNFFSKVMDLSKVRILCLSTQVDNETLWAYYAESNAGCMLGFRHIEEMSTPLLEAKPVSYSEEAPVVGSGLDLLLYVKPAGIEEKTIRAVCYTKKLHWEVEREWRAMVYRPNEVGALHSDFLFYPEELESVTLGVRATQKTEDMVRRELLANYPGACLYRMESVHGNLTRHRLS
jgi:hypothetical protein